MNATLATEGPAILQLHARKAADLMTPNPVSLRADATAAEAIALLTARAYSAAPVIGDNGRPIGVLSQSDLLIHACGKGAAGNAAHVRDLMTPVVFSVSPHTTAAKVVEQMLALKVHRLFVVDETGVLIGVISAMDVLHHLEA